MRRAWLILAVLGLLAVPAAGWATISSRITDKESQIAGKKAKEQVLTTDIQGFSEKIGALQNEIDPLQSRQDTLQADLDAKLARLDEIQDDLRSERARLVTLRAKLVSGRETLGKRLVELYKAGDPDILDVVLNADGFEGLIEDAEFARRIGEQDNRILNEVRDAKSESVRTEAHLDSLSDEQTAIAASVEQQRDAVAAIKEDLVVRRDGLASVRSEKNAVLNSIQEERHELEGDLSALRKQQAEIQARLANPTGAAPGPVQQGSGGLIWPVNGPIVSPFGQRWGRLHAGVDIAIPTGTPVRASAGGSVRIAGWVSGYGNYVCIQHAGALSTCYGHNTSIAVTVGQSVDQGQVISYAGCTGHCYGPHVHFETRINGAPVDPSQYL